MSNSSIDFCSSLDCPLRPYPELPEQNNVVNCVWNFSETIRKISSFISYPFRKIASFFSFPVKVELTNKKISPFPDIFIKTATETFDHKFYYIIREGKVYFKPMRTSQTSDWKEIPFAKTATYISADGDNLIVLDQNRRVHYAKTNAIDFHFTENSWEVTSFKLKWQKDWFNMDLVAPIVNFFKPAGLYPMEGARSIAMSHKGDTLYYTDTAGKKHPRPFIGVTTVYQLDPSGTRILFADPRLSNQFHNELTAPQEGRFIAESMDASGSTLFLIQRAKDAEGKEIHKMYTRYADFDSIEANPFLPATYDRNNTTPLVRILPGEDWLEQPSIVLEGRAHLTKQITITQTGRGQNQRQLRVEGTDSHGYAGYYHKMIYAKTWSFERTNHNIPAAAFLPEEERGLGLQLGPQIAQDYHGFVQTKEGVFPAVLRNFSFKGLNERNLHTLLEVQKPDGKSISYPLYARRGMTHLLEMKKKKPNWTLVSPDSKVKVVKVAKSAENILVTGKGLRANFSLNDKISPPPPRPPFFTRLYAKGALFFLGTAKDLLKIIRRIADKILQLNSTLKAEERLRQSLSLEDDADTKKVIQRLLAKNPTLAPQSVVDLLIHPAICTHLRKLMMGANAVILDDGEHLFQQLKNTPGAKSRVSSHPSLPGTSYGLETPLFGELLFWMDREGKFRFQFEAHSVKNLIKLYYHFCDFLHYRAHGRQQGKYGSSCHTDAAPLVIGLKNQTGL